jgi:hypothetical protein
VGPSRRAFGPEAFGLPVSCGELDPWHRARLRSLRASASSS